MGSFGFRAFCYAFTLNMEIAAIKKAIDDKIEITTTSTITKSVICEYIPALVISTIYVKGFM